MIFRLKTLLFLIAPLVFVQGCYRDEIITISNPSTLPHKLGVYVLSEGNGNPDQSALSFLSFATGDYNYNITFPSVLGLYPDGLIDYNGSALYVTERGTLNSSGKIYKMDTNGIIVSSNNIGVNPYSLVGVFGKAYVTNGPDSSVSVVDLNSLNEIKRIKVGLYPQEILSINNKVFVANTKINGGGTDSTISVIDVTRNEQILKFRVNAYPSSLAISKDGFLLVSSSGSGGMIYKYSPNTYQRIDSFFVNSLTIGDMNVDYNSDNLYFIKDHFAIYKLNLTSKEVSPVIVPSGVNTIEYINGYGYDVKSQKHYIADARDFSRQGYLYKFNSSGVLESGFQTGIAPRRILIRN